MARAFLGTATALLSVFAFATAALAGTSTSETISGNGASANFTTIDGCTLNNIVVTAGANVTTLPGGGTSTTAVDITIASSDICTGLNLGTSSGGVTNIPFNGDLNSATVNANVPVIDGNGNASTINIGVSWTGTGTITRANMTTKTVTGNVTTTIHTRNASRPATVTAIVDGLSGSSTAAMLFQDATVTKTRTK
jgi:hypothetical protein